MIAYCRNPKCVSEFQDKVYGKDRRVHNYAPGASGHRCTVCSTMLDKQIRIAKVEDTDG